MYVVTIVESPNGDCKIAYDLNRTGEEKSCEREQQYAVVIIEGAIWFP